MKPAEPTVKELERNSYLSRIVLGAAAFGQAYGIANPASVAEGLEIDKLLNRAWERGVRRIDTAAIYGSADERIGAWINRTGNAPEIISKIPPIETMTNGQTQQDIESYTLQTLTTLGIDKLDGLLTHHANDIFQPTVQEAFERLKEQGHVGAAGISAYSAKHIDDAINLSVVDTAQIPTSLFDRRVTESGTHNRCLNAGIRLFGRSVFLQGLVFLDPSTLPAFFAPAKSTLQKIGDIASESELSPTHLALAYAFQRFKGVDLIIGCRSESQIEEICDIAETGPLNTDVYEALDRVGGGLPDQIIDPRLWPK